METAVLRCFSVRRDPHNALIVASILLAITNQSAPFFAALGVVEPQESENFAHVSFKCEGLLENIMRMLSHPLTTHIVALDILLLIRVCFSSR